MRDFNEIQFFLFDLDGTVTDSSEGITKSVREALKTEGIDEPLCNLRKFIGPSLRYSFGKYTSDLVQRDRMLANYRARYSTVGWKEVKIYDGMKTLFEKLKSEGKSVVLASAKPEVFCIDILKFIGVYDLFDFVGGSDLEGKRDDKTVLMQYVLDNLGNPPPKKCIMVGDRFYDIRAAHDHDIECVGVKFGFAEGDELQKAGADYIVDTVGDLQSLLTGIGGTN